MREIQRTTTKLTLETQEMKSKRTIMALSAIFLFAICSNAQFYTIVNNPKKIRIREIEKIQIVDTLVFRDTTTVVDTVRSLPGKEIKAQAMKAYKNWKETDKTLSDMEKKILLEGLYSDFDELLQQKGESWRNMYSGYEIKKNSNVTELDDMGLPKLTLLNVYDEILKNGIMYPKIVLAQAILETGWLRSSVCRNKNNLFGLTNPRTGQYYEFNHWTESVRAYFTKVQYRYRGGDYLRWLAQIGYAEAPDYTSVLRQILRTYLE